MTKQTARIENWIAIPSKDSPLYLIGQILNHPNQENYQTDVQITSTIVKASFSDGVVETRNTIYSLGAEMP